MKKVLPCLLLLLVFSKTSFTQEHLPGDPSKIAYEKAMLSLQIKKDDEAKNNFEVSMQAGGPYGDLSRLMVIRMQGKNLKSNENLENQIMKLLQGFEDQRLLPVAYFSAIQALNENNLSTETINLAHEFSLRFPKHNLADDSLLIAAQSLFRKKKYRVALYFLNQVIVKNIETTDRYNDALYLKSEIYFSDWIDRSPSRACGFIAKTYKNHSAFKIPKHISLLYNLHCQGV